MALAKYAVLLHAGTTETWETNPCLQQEIEQTLYQIAERAGSQLASGANTLDFVEFVVAALEDCPLFNVSEEAALNENGKHEVSLLHHTSTL